MAVIVINVVAQYGNSRRADKLFGADLIVIVIMFASFLVSWGFFVAFAFGDWPALQVEPVRTRSAWTRTRDRSGRPDRARMGGAPACLRCRRRQSATTRVSPRGGTARVPLGAGEQSYWDGIDLDGAAALAERTPGSTCRPRSSRRPRRSEAERRL